MSGIQGIKLRMWYEAWYKESYRAYRHPVRMPICLVWVELTPRERDRNTDSLALERDTMRTLDSGSRYIGVSLT